MKTDIKVLIVDDSAMVRRIFTQELSRERGITVGVPAAGYLSLIESDPENGPFPGCNLHQPYLFFQRKKQLKYLARSDRNIRCAAASSGEEPYSLAIHYLKSGFAPSILATDISNTCLKKGERAVYPEKCAASLPKDILRQYFQKGPGEWQDSIRVKKEVRQMVTFERFNLVRDCPPAKVFDSIFCRNVMIYFDSPTKEKILHKLTRALKHGGYFIIGGAESLTGLNHDLKYIEPSVYRKC